MSCLNCGYSNYTDGETCFQCGYTPCTTPDIEYPVPSALQSPETSTDTAGIAPWKVICPMCKKQSFDRWNCANPECNYSILEKMRKMRGRILSPEEADRIRKELDIP